MGTEKKPASTKQAGANKTYYAAQFARTQANKARRLARRQRWLAKRQSLEVQNRLNTAWYIRHTSKPHADKILSAGVRYTLPCPIYVYPKSHYEGAN